MHALAYTYLNQIIIAKCLYNLKTENHRHIRNFRIACYIEPEWIYSTGTLCPQTERRGCRSIIEFEEA